MTQITKLSWNVRPNLKKAPSLEPYKDGDYWDPLTDTYKSKKTRNNDSDDETFWECPTKPEIGIETETTTEHKVDANDGYDSASAWSISASFNIYLQFSPSAEHVKFACNILPNIACHKALNITAHSIVFLIIFGFIDVPIKQKPNTRLIPLIYFALPSHNGISETIWHIIT